MKSIMVEEESGTHLEASSQEPLPPPERLPTQEQELFVPPGQQEKTEDELSDLDQPQKTSDINEPSENTSDFPNLDHEKFFKLLVDCQSRRMDDQRVALNLLPGLQVLSLRGTGTLTEWESEQLYNIISRAQSSRMEDQRCTLPQIILTPGTPENQRKTYSRPETPTQDLDDLPKPPLRSDTFSPVSPQETTQNYNNLNNLPHQEIPLAEQETLLALIAQALRGRMEDQRCFLDPSMRSSPSQNYTNVLPQGLDPEQFFKLVAHIQSRRLDDQRVQLDFLPGFQTPAGAAQVPLKLDDLERLCNVVSRVQSPRMDDQRCNAPHIQLGSPAPPRKVCSTPPSPTRIPPDTASPSNAPDAAAPVSAAVAAAVSPPAETQQQNNLNHTTQTELSSDQDRLFSMVCQAQARRMEDQRCALECFRQILATPKELWPTLDTDHFFSLVAKAQSKRLDDQRAEMPSLQEVLKMPTTPKIVVTPGSPAAPRRASCCFSAAPPVQDSDALPKPPPPRSASFSPVSERERTQCDSNPDNLPNQLTFQVSVCLTPRQMRKSDSEPCSYPDVFLKIGQPGGEACVIPLSSSFSGQTLLDAPRQSGRHHSRSSSPHRGRARTSRTRPHSPDQAAPYCPIGPDEDYFSLINRVHTAQLRKGSTVEKNRESRNGKGKGDGRREKKSRGKRK